MAVKQAGNLVKREGETVQWAEEAVRLASELDIQKKWLYSVQLEMERFSEKERLYDKQMRQEIDNKVRLYCKQNGLFSEQEWLNSEQVKLKIMPKNNSVGDSLYQFNDTQSRQHSVSPMSTWIQSQKCKCFNSRVMNLFETEFV